LRFLEGIQDDHAGRYSRAIERLTWARNRLPESLQAAVHLILGHCQEKQGDLAEAERTYRAALQLDPKAVTPRLSLGRLLMATRLEEAAKEIEQGLELDPNQPALLLSLAEIKLREQRVHSPERRNWTDFDN